MNINTSRPSTLRRKCNLYYDCPCPFPSSSPFWLSVLHMPRAPSSLTPSCNPTVRRTAFAQLILIVSQAGNKSQHQHQLSSRGMAKMKVQQQQQLGAELCGIILAAVVNLHKQREENPLECCNCRGETQPQLSVSFGPTMSTISSGKELGKLRGDG